MIRLLLVEDDVNFSYVVKESLLLTDDYEEVFTASNGREGLELWKEKRPDVIVSDIDMPEMDGYEMVRRIRETDREVVILLASGLQSVRDVKKGYELGVDMYIKKPYSPVEIDLHLQAALKRRRGARMENTEGMYRMGTYTLDIRQATLRNENTGGRQHLTPREAGVLQLLAENPGEVVPRNVILERLWENEDSYFASRSLDVLLVGLRKHFDADGGVEIKTVKKVGIVLLVR